MNAFEKSPLRMMTEQVAMRMMRGEFDPAAPAICPVCGHPVERFEHKYGTQVFGPHEFRNNTDMPRRMHNGQNAVTIECHGESVTIPWVGLPK